MANLSSYPVAAFGFQTENLQEDEPLNRVQRFLGRRPTGTPASGSSRIGSAIDKIESKTEKVITICPAVISSIINRKIRVSPTNLT